MAIEQERDPYTGHLTTGHEWNGIIELNTPVPKVIYVIFAISFVVSVILWILLPAWPTGRSFTKGLLGDDQKASVEAALAKAAEARRGWAEQIAQKPFAEIEKDAALMSAVRDVGPALFDDNCAACHRRDLKGQKGFPNLTSDYWLWGGSADAIFDTISYGVNSANPKSRASQMPAWGRDQMISEADVNNVVAYVASLSNRAPDGSASAVTAGKAVFAANCAACHGENAEGNPEMGAPTLHDHAWLYGGDLATLHETVWGGRQGHMPTWENRLSVAQRKILAMYIVDMRGKTR